MPGLRIDALDDGIALGRVVFDERDEAGERDFVGAIETLQKLFQARTHIGFVVHVTLTFHADSEPP